jgi:hypothetical protein
MRPQGMTTFVVHPFMPFLAVCRRDTCSTFKLTGGKSNHLFHPSLSDALHLSLSRPPGFFHSPYKPDSLVHVELPDSYGPYSRDQSQCWKNASAGSSQVGLGTGPNLFCPHSLQRCALMEWIAIYQNSENKTSIKSQN